MKKYLCIYLPSWSIDLIRRSPALKEDGPSDKALLLVAQSGNDLIVKRFCERAAASGIRDGTNLNLAKALLSCEARVENFDPLRECRALFKLARWAQSFAPFCGIDGEMFTALKEGRAGTLSPFHNGLILDISGTERLYPDPLVLAKRIFDKLRQGGFAARIAIAPSIGAAWGLSRFSRDEIVVASPDQLISTISGLPVEALRLDSETLSGLNELGVLSIYTLLKLPRPALGSRFNPSLLERLDQALDLWPENLHLVSDPPLFKVSRAFEYMLTRHEAIVQTCLTLFEEIFKALKGGNKRAGRFVLNFYGRSESGSPISMKKELALNSAIKSMAELRSIITVLTEFKVQGGIEVIVLTAHNTERDRGVQGDFIAGPDAAHNTEKVKELMNNLVVRLGKDRIRKVRFHSSYIPERAYSYYSIQDELKSILKSADENHPARPERPPYIFEEPEPIKAISLLPDRSPSRIRWNGVDYDITLGSEPERIGAEWWQASLNEPIDERDYFKVQDQTGRWLWVYRNKLTHNWYIQGLWA
jgi:protein ImuB